MLATVRGPCAALLVAACAACSSGDRDGASAPEADAGGDGGGDAPGCVLGGAPWQRGRRAFREATADWGLDALGVEAVRVSVIDLDGDLWPDLLVRAGGGPDDFGPGGDRARWLLRNTGAGAFEDVTQESGLLAARRSPDAGGHEGEVVASADVDNDGDTDVLLATDVADATDPAAETSEILLNDGTGVFSLGPEASDARGEGVPSAPRGAAFVDVDRDGAVDLFVSQDMLALATSPLQDQLFLGDGAGGFVEATHELGLTAEPWNSPVEVLDGGLGRTRGWGATACDLDDDGIPEILSSSYGRAPNHLWQGSETPEGTVAFTNRSVESGYAYDQRVDWTDNVNARCHCADHPDDDECDRVPPPPSASFCKSLWDGFGGRYRWSHATDRELWRLGGVSATTTCADVNNDGFADLMTGEIVHSDVGSSADPAELLINAGDHDLHFERPGNEVTGLTREHAGDFWNDGDMNNAVFDFDGDGWLDVYVSSSDYPGTRGLLFHQAVPGRFEAVPLEDGIDHLRSAGVAAVDLDRDGDLDLVVGHSRFRCDAASTDCYATQRLRVFENVSDGANHWLELRLEGGPGTNRMAVGARVTVEACGTTQTRFVDGGHGHMGTQEDRVLHFGLGDRTSARVTVHWPDAGATAETFEVEADAVYEVRQGDRPAVREP